ncbi:interferon-induced very large GTPase 1-like [Mustelus asterias]
MGESIDRGMIRSVHSSVSECTGSTGQIDLSKFKKLLQTLGLQDFYPNKLSLKKVLEIDIEALEGKIPTCAGDIPWHFLRLLMAGNSSARIFQPPRLESMQDETVEDDFDFFPPLLKPKTTVVAFNPLDIITALLLCADTFLQQEVISKMSLCQFAVPIILPCPEGSPTFLLRPMHSIVKRYRPHSMGEKREYIEDSMATAHIPTFAFTRLGHSSMSKSKMLNHIFSNSHQQLHYFIHSDMPSGNIVKDISNGLMEMCWYLPYGSEAVDIIPEPLAIMNLRGNALDFPGSFQFLSKVAAAVFVFIDCLDTQIKTFLLSHAHISQKLFLIVTPKSHQMRQMNLHLKELVKSKFLTKDQVLPKFQENEAEFLSNVRSKILATFSRRSEFKEKAPSLQEMASLAKESTFLIDEDVSEFSEARGMSIQIVNSIHNGNIKEFKQKHLYFQGDAWKKISDIEKEICRLKHFTGPSVGEYISKLREEGHVLCQGLIGRGMSDVMMNVISFLQPATNRKHFLNCLKYDLDSRSRTELRNLSERRMVSNGEAEQQVQNSVLQNPQAELHSNVSDSSMSLGLEHFLREMGLIYQVFQTVKTIPPDIKQFPSIAAELLLEGFPLELMDGDVSNIPVEWVSSVLTEVDRKVGPCCIFVLSVLGVQSTGKSTLLNTMFGSQFAVGCGRCTRGVYMQLIKTTRKIHNRGCDFILLLDTEGLEAQEQSSVGDTYEHDNELATLVSGLSDLTLINMSTETASEMKEVLQIVVHALIRMKTVGKRPNCQFLHQKIGDVSAYQKNVRSHSSIQQELDQMTKIAAKAEKQDGKFSKFSDVLDYDSKKSNWYIPGLWCGTPPMAPVEVAYSQTVAELKHNILQHFLHRRPSTITDFISWMKSTWDAVKHESFIFSFRNSQVANAYNKLSEKCSDLDWKMRSEVHSWLQKAHIRIKTCKGDLQDLEEILTREVLEVMSEQKTQQLNEIEDYFKTDTAQAHLVERFKAEISASFESVCWEIETLTKRQCAEAVIRQKELNKLNNILSGYSDRIQGRVDQLLNTMKLQTADHSESELIEAFENMWTESMQSVKYQPVEFNIERDMEKSLRENMRTCGNILTEKLASGTSLCDLSKRPWKIAKQHIEASKRSLLKRILEKAHEVYSNLLQTKVNLDNEDTEAWVESECSVEAGRITKVLISQCKLHVEEMVKKGEDYHPLLCKKLLREIDGELEKLDGETFQFTELFDTDVKIQICGFAVQRFREMHNGFCDQHNPVKRLANDRNHYFTIFKSMYSQKDQSETCAKLFCDSLLKPALLEDLNQGLGKAIVDHIRNGQNAEFKSRRNLQVGIMLDLKRQNSFEEYWQYIKNSEDFEQDWMRKQVLNHCKRLDNRQSTLYHIAANILEQKIKLMQTTIEDIKKSPTDDIGLFLDAFKQRLEEHIVFPQGYLENKNIFKNAPSFVLKLADSIHNLEGCLLQDIVKWDIEQRVSDLPTDPSRELYKILCGCGKHCPFCEVPCEQTIKDHEKHSATYHWPQGIGGCNFRWNKKLTTESCEAVASQSYWYQKEGERLWQRVARSCKEFMYRKFYIETRCKRADAWDIPLTPKAQAPSYWKWVLSTYNKEFALKYNVKPADISNSDTPWDINADLEKHYDVKIDEYLIYLTPTGS